MHYLPFSSYSSLAALEIVKSFKEIKYRKHFPDVPTPATTNNHNCFGNATADMQSHARWNNIESEMSGFVMEYIKSGGLAKNLEEGSDRKDGVAKNLKNHSKGNVELAKILKGHSERKEHSGRSELAKNLRQNSRRNAQLVNDLEKHLRRNDKVTKIFDGSSGWLQPLFAQEVSIFDQQKISVEKSSLPGKIPSVVDTKKSDELLRKFESSSDKPKWQRDRKWNVQDPAS
ncbi:hypothetical protein BU17DRAFT_62626 [Hysterangium stoloniferum]|nr:hypothetical protein BU17DRAFT_62626 [Hysterangium stoloniferum]